MATIVKRSKRTSSGARKNRAGKNCARKGPAVMLAHVASFLKVQRKNSRHPSPDQIQTAWDLKNEKKPRGRKPGAIKPAQPVGFTVYDACMSSNPAAVKTLLLAASLKVKKVRRYPGWFLERVYNLKNRPIEII